MKTLQTIGAAAALTLCVMIAACSKSTTVAGQPDQTSTASTSAQTSTDSASAPATAYTGSPSDGNLAPVQNASYEVPANAQGDYYPDYNTQEAPVYAPAPPPALPNYTQPESPGDDEIWTPGYWNYGSDGYYWVPGAWVMAPYVGALWTPPYWAFESGRYRLHPGFWAPHIGYYGGVNYGYGYVGHGYYGGYWRGNDFLYNRDVTRVNSNAARNAYDYHVSAPNVRTSYVGGNGGLRVRPTAAELAVMREQIRPPVAAQNQHRDEAARDRTQFVAANHGRPATTVAARPLEVGYRAPAARPAGMEPRAAQSNRPEPNAAARPMNEGHPVPESRPQDLHAGAPGRPAEQGRAAEPGRPTPPQQRAEEHAAPQAAVNRPAPAPRVEQRAFPQPGAQARPVPAPREETRPAQMPNQRVEARPAPQPQQTRPAPEPRAETRPMQAPNQHVEARPAPQPQRMEARPAPAPRAETHPAPAPAAAAHPEAHPEPQHTEAKPAPPLHPAGGHPDDKKPPDHH